MIFGDSYSTFAGCIPAGYAPYYSGRRERGPDIENADQSWWGLMVKETEVNLVRNDSWSGSTICCTGYEGKDFSHCAFINRLDMYLEQGYFKENRIDTLFVLGATNDSWSDAPIGQLQYEGWTKEDLYRVLPAVGYLAKRLSESFPDTRLLYIINDGLKEEITQGILTACDHFGIPTLCLENIDKLAGHPTIAGMQQIADQVAAHLKNSL
jgi:hypothetical protein